MKKDWELTPEAFDALLDWLHPDREQAAQEYENIRRRLIRFFLGRGCAVAEELADETINRVTVKVPELTQYEGDKALYFYRVADFVYREWIKERSKWESEPREFVGPRPNPDDDEKKDECLKRCLAELSDENCTLFLEFNDKEKRAKIEHRKTLAIQCGITVNALRIRAHRIRIRLKQCITQCLDDLPGN